MSAFRACTTCALLAATALAATSCGGAASSRTTSAGARRGGGAAPGTLQARLVRHTSPRPSAAALAASLCARRPPEQPVTSRRWLAGFIVTEYYPVPERWFDGVRVRTPGSGSLHRVDWLYSANGVSMEGDGIDLAGRHMHIDNLGSVGWVNSAGRATVPPHCGIHWSAGPPAWRAGGWRNAAGDVTYPLAGGGWSHGAGHWTGGYGGATFLPGSSLALRYYSSVAVDPGLIPEGSRIYIPAYRDVNGGWFVAQDTGGAIIGRHIDVYRPPTAQPFGTGRLLLDQRVYVIPPGS